MGWGGWSGIGVEWDRGGVGDVFHVEHSGWASPRFTSPWRCFENTRRAGAQRSRERRAPARRVQRGPPEEGSHPLLSPAWRINEWVSAIGGWPTNNLTHSTYFWHLPAMNIPFIRHAHRASVSAAVVLLLSSCCWSAEQAYVDSITEIKNSFHWDHVAEGVAQVAVTERVLLSEKPANLTTLNFNPSDSSLYRVREISGTSQNCVLLTTFTKKDEFWQAAVPQQDLQLRSGTGDENDLFTWVTAGSDLKNYLAENYASSLTADTVDRRMSQALGMPDLTGEEWVLASFWVPLDLVLRPAYSADIGTQISYDTLLEYSDNSYAVTDGSSGGPDFTFQDYDSTFYSGEGGFGEFVMNNQAETEMPWTAMGYTYNWNFLEDGLSGRAEDANRASSYVGVSEFVVSAGAWVQFDSFIENDALYPYLIPEPGSLPLLIFSTGLICLWKRHRIF